MIESYSNWFLGLAIFLIVGFVVILITDTLAVKKMLKKKNEQKKFCESELRKNIEQKGVNIEEIKIE